MGGVIETCYDRHTEAYCAAQSDWIWGMASVLILLAIVVSILIAFAAGVVHLFKSWKRKRPSR